MDFSTEAANYVGQGAGMGCLVWLVVYGVNRGWLAFKGLTS